MAQVDVLFFTPIAYNLPTPIQGHFYRISGGHRRNNQVSAAIR